MLECLKGRRVALAHHWLMSMRGGEKVLQAVAERVPQAPIFTLLAKLDALSPTLRSRDIRTSFLQKLPYFRERHRLALPLYPTAARSLDCREFDIVICSDASVAKGVRSRPDALKICYCHSPMRYAWDLQDAYRRHMPLAQSLGLRVMSPWLRRWDRRAADTVTAFIANSRHVQSRIRRAYGRASEVVYPPVETPTIATLRSDDGAALSGEYLVVSELVEYKRVDLAVAACTQLNRPLIVVGDGPTRRRLERAAGPTVRFLGRVSDEEVARRMASCRALLFCGEEDFGMVPVEVQMHGRPVIALGRGGALETVEDGRTGVLFGEPSIDSLARAIERFEQSLTLLPRDEIRRHAARFSAERFRDAFDRFVTRLVEIWDAGGASAVREACERGQTSADAAPVAEPAVPVASPGKRG